MIRFLKSGESVPSFSPKRYVNGQRYVRLRWKVGNREYLEVWEHRVKDGKVVDAIIHHKNHDKKDNSPENLVRCRNDAEHSFHHRRIDHSEVAGLYRNGMSTIKLAEVFSTDTGNISRILKRQGVVLRFGKGKPGNRLGFRAPDNLFGRPSLVIPNV